MCVLFYLFNLFLLHRNLITSLRKLKQVLIFILKLIQNTFTNRMYKIVSTRFTINWIRFSNTANNCFLRKRNYTKISRKNISNELYSIMMSNALHSRLDSLLKRIIISVKKKCIWPSQLLQRMKEIYLRNRATSRYFTHSLLHYIILGKK